VLFGATPTTQCLNATIQSGSTLNLNGFTLLINGTTTTNHGTLNGTAANSRLYFFGADLLSNLKRMASLPDLDGALAQDRAISTLGDFDDLHGTRATQSYTGSGVVTAPLDGLSIDNPSGVTITSSNSIPTLRMNLFRGTVGNSNKITLGNAGTTT